jgi:TatD-related deoxyribonuclease
VNDAATPVLDNHLHLDPERGKGMEAVREFARAGGTHLLVVNRPSWEFLAVEEPADFRAVFEATVDTVERAAAELPGTAWPVLGVHPALVSRLIGERGFSPEAARELMCGGLELAAEYAAEGVAVALKTGRPHYEVEEAVWDAANAVLRRGLELGAEAGVAVQLHTEATDDLTEVGEWAADAGLAPERVVKHYAGGRCAGVTPSVMSRKADLREAAERGEPFLMETDFLDDPERPGAVLGPKTVPRRVAWLDAEGHDGAVRNAHVRTPERVYGVDTVGTLDRA